jgi:hypothetical protein
MISLRAEGLSKSNLITGVLVATLGLSASDALCGNWLYNPADEVAFLPNILKGQQSRCCGRPAIIGSSLCTSR